MAGGGLQHHGGDENNSVADNTVIFLRMDSLKNDVMACLRQVMVWKGRSQDEMDTTLKQIVDGKVSKMDSNFKAYKLAMAVKKIALHPSGAPNPSGYYQEGKALLYLSFTSNREVQRVFCIQILL